MFNCVKKLFCNHDYKNIMKHSEDLLDIAVHINYCKKCKKVQVKKLSTDKAIFSKWVLFKMGTLSLIFIFGVIYYVHSLINIFFNHV
jgi:hypothetical protein